MLPQPVSIFTMPKFLFQEYLQNSIKVVRADKRSEKKGCRHDCNLKWIPSPNRRHNFLSKERYYNLRDWTINVAQNTSTPVEETDMLMTDSVLQAVRTGIFCPHALGQCSSTFVRPRPGKFFFHKTRARSQQIYSSVPFQFFFKFIH